MRRRQRPGSASRRQDSASSQFAPPRRAIVAGGIGAAALIALPDVGARGATTGTAAARGLTSPGGASGGITTATNSGDAAYAFVYGTLSTAPYTGGTVAATPAPSGSPAASPRPAAANGSAKPAVLPAAVPVASMLASAPVTSPDQATTVLATVDGISGGQRITLTLVDKAQLTVTAQGSIDITGIPDGTNILVTPVFATGTTVIPVVLAITVPTPAGSARKVDPVTGKPGTYPATAYRSQHAIAYFDSATSVISGPYYVHDEPSLALTTVAANSTQLFVVTTKEPQPAASLPAKAPVSQMHAYPLGSGKARFSVPAFGPWPGGEPVVTLGNGDIARLVNGRTIQVFGAKNGDLTQHTVAPINAVRAKPSSLTMETRSDGTVFLTKPGIGKAVIADPAHEFKTVREVTFPVPDKPAGTPWSKAVLSADASTLYTVGSAKTGGLAAYDVKTGALAGMYSQEEQYTGVYLMPSGSLLAVSGPANPRLSFFSPGLSPLGTASTTMQVAAVY